jgi:hypothetical protein
VETNELYVDPEAVDPDPEQDDSYDPDAKRERFGNNRYHIPKSVAKAKRKSAKIARRKNRK